MCVMCVWDPAALKGNLKILEMLVHYLKAVFFLNQSQ